MKQLGLLLMVILLYIGMYANDKSLKSDFISQASTVQNEGIKQSVKDSILYQKLSSEQLMELKRQENEIEQQKNHECSTWNSEDVYSKRKRKIKYLPYKCWMWKQKIMTNCSRIFLEN